MFASKISGLGAVVLFAAFAVFSISCASKKPSLPADASTPETLQATLEKIRAKNNLVALGGAIVRLGQPTEIATTGLRKKGSPEPVTDQDLWHLGSDGKAMTATVIAIMVEEGKLKWDQTIGESFPDLADKMKPVYKDVTLQQLLDHRGGIVANIGATRPYFWAKIMKDRTTPPMDQRQEFAAEVLAASPDAKPGTKMVYSNAGYVLAAMIAERAAKKPWEDLIREKLFVPLAMTSPGFGWPGTGELVDQPWGHDAGIFKKTPMRADNPRAFAPAGTIYMSLGDWAKFVAFHMGAPATRADGKPLLSKESLAHLHTPAPGLDYTCGWGTAERGWAGGTALTHAGSNTMWFAVVWIAPKKDTAVLVVTNQAGPLTPYACDDAAVALLNRAGLTVK